MAFNKENFVEELKTMSVLELNELVKAIEEEFGVSAAAPVAAGVVTEDLDAAPTTVDVTLKEAGGTKLAVIKVIRSIDASLGLKEAKAIADNGGIIKAGVSAEEGKEIAAQLEEAGATIELV